MAQGIALGDFLWALLGLAHRHAFSISASALSVSNTLAFSVVAFVALAHPLDFREVEVFHSAFAFVDFSFTEFEVVFTWKA